MDFGLWIRFLFRSFAITYSGNRLTPGVEQRFSRAPSFVLLIPTSVFTIHLPKVLVASVGFGFGFPRVLLFLQPSRIDSGAAICTSLPAMQCSHPSRFLSEIHFPDSIVYFRLSLESNHQYSVQLCLWSIASQSLVAVGH